MQLVFPIRRGSRKLRQVSWERALNLEKNHWRSMRSWRRAAIPAGISFSYYMGRSLTSMLDPDLEYKSGAPGKGEWAWNANCPADFIPSQRVYEQFIGAAT
jgi:hypothetical protein